MKLKINHIFLICLIPLFLIAEVKEQPTMMIAIGSTNRVKIEALEEVLRDYPLLAKAKVASYAVPSGISEQPLFLEETIRGAKNRAKAAYESCPSCSYSFGIESGLFEAPGTQTGFLEATICCIYDGKDYHMGISSGFEVPPKVLSLVLEKKLDLNQACFETGITQDKTLGAGEGLVGLLTRGRLTRKAYTKQSIVTALVQIEHLDWYRASAAVPL